MYVKNNKVGIPTYLSTHEEAFMFSAEEIDVAHRFSIGTDLLSYKIQSVVELVKARPTCKEIDPQYSEKYCRTVFKRVNVSEEAHDKGSKKSKT